MATKVLTPQEARVARLVGDGLGNTEIAGRMKISDNTVRYHLKEIYSKLAIGSRTKLTRLVILATNQH